MFVDISLVSISMHHMHSSCSWSQEEEGIRYFGTGIMDGTE